MKLQAVLLAAALTGCAAAAPPAAIPAAAPTPTSEETALPSNWSGMQWMYGSGEGAAASLQTYRALTAHALAAKANRPASTVVLADPANLSGGFVPCDDKPLAVILDADETLIQNLGYEYALATRGLTSGGPLLKAYQMENRPQSVAMPGAVEALDALRAAGITVVANSNRDNDTAAGTAASLAGAGLGTFEHGKTLFLRGDVDGARGKESRRSHVAERYCVVAMAGDTLGDFSDAFNDDALGVLERRALAARYADRWGNGWFMVSNPVYGHQLDGDIDEIFPEDVRWQGENE